MRALRDKESDHKVQINPKNNACQAARCSYYFKFLSPFSYCPLILFFFFFTIFLMCFYVLAHISMRDTETP